MLPLVNNRLFHIDVFVKIDKRNSAPLFPVETWRENLTLWSEHFWIGKEYNTGGNRTWANKRWDFGRVAGPVGGRAVQP